MGVPKTNGLAVGSMVCSLIGLLLFGIILGPIGLILGIVAVSPINGSAALQKGKGRRRT